MATDNRLGEYLRARRELARPADRRRRRPPSRPERAGASVQQLIDGWTRTPAHVLGRHLDVLAANALGGTIASCPAPGVNQVWTVFLEERGVPPAVGAARRAGQDRRDQAVPAPDGGRATLRYETLAIAIAPGQLIVAYHAEPGSPSEQALAH